MEKTNILGKIISTRKFVMMPLKIHYHKIRGAKRLKVRPYYKNDKANLYLKYLVKSNL